MNSSTEPVDNMAPTVNPTDLQRVFTLMRTVQGQARGQHTAINIKAYEELCSAGSDAKAVWYRASMLLMLCMGPLAAQHGDLDEKVFTVVAQFPMKQMQPGAPEQGPPFDVNEFLQRIEQT